MNNNKEIFLHIGYPKAASSTLQRNVFSKHPEINYLGLHYDPSVESTYSPDFPYVKFWNNLNKLNEIEYKCSNNYQIYIDYIYPLLLDEKVNLLSHESVIDSCRNDNVLKAYRLKELFPDAKIIIILRHQVDIIRSLYDGKPYHPFDFSFSEFKKKEMSFDEWMSMALHPDYFSKSYLAGIKYYEHISLYCKLFGKNKVGIFLFEDLVHHPTLFADNLSKFIGVNPEITKQLIINSTPQNTAALRSYYRIRSRFIPKFTINQFIPKWLYKNIKNTAITYISNNHKKIQVSQQWQEEISALYKNSNRRVVEEFDIDLARYKYPL